MYNEYKHILVPVDGSKLAEAALFKAAEVAIRNEARLDVLNVLNTTSFGFSYGVVDGDAITDMVNDELDYLKKLIQRVKKATGIEDIHMHLRFGSPRNVITYDFPHDYQVDLIMMGATGKNAVSRLLVGSVTSFVNTHARCDVAVVRTGMDNQTAE
ncbi:universal stress protein [Fructilactobacillus ixorae]|uniref:Universal stress protein n=2 Tax=Fructilactobacillus TaxID=2767881 RepID=A0ABY5BPU8_9LACO|nr:MULTISPECIES: universal stress protein [Fructilactobacillus]USS85708.1 universal stress protein [Fructilactobacillus myrtifloralis]USS93071.1 universal stress protein [Fructilactobacillus ixorae]